MQYIVDSEGLQTYKTAVTHNAVLDVLRIKKPQADYAKRSDVLAWLEGYGLNNKTLNAWISQGDVTVQRIGNADKLSMVEVSNQVVKYVESRYLKPIYEF